MGIAIISMVGICAALFAFAGLRRGRVGRVSRNAVMRAGLRSTLPSERWERHVNDGVASVHLCSAPPIAAHRGQKVGQLAIDSKSFSRGFTVIEILIVVVVLGLLAGWCVQRVGSGRCTVCDSPEGYAHRRAQSLEQATMVFRTLGGTITGKPAKPMTVARANEIVRQVTARVPGRPELPMREFPQDATFPKDWGEVAPGEFSH